MTKLQLLLLVGVVAVSLALSLILHRNAQARISKNDEELRRQETQLTELLKEQERLSHQVAEANDFKESQSSERAKLAEQDERLRQQTNELRTQLGNSRKPPGSEAGKGPRSPEYYRELHRLAASRPKDAVGLVQAVLVYAAQHQNHLPAGLDELAPYLREGGTSVSGASRFEIVFRGSLDELKGIPTGGVALIRDPQSWTAPSGKLARVYGMANGSAQIVESDDDFKSWEAEHILPAPQPAK